MANESVKKYRLCRTCFFIHDTREVLDLFVRKIPTLQYRYQKGGGYCQPMMVADLDMERFYTCCPRFGKS